MFFFFWGGVVRENATDLNPTEDRGEDQREVTVGSPRSDVQQKSDGVKRGRLDERGDHSLVNSANPGCGTRSLANVPAVQDQSNDNHEREQDVERNGNRVVRNGDVDADRVSVGNIRRLHCLIDEQDPHCCASATSVKDVTIGLRRTKMRTDSGEVHQAWEGDDPVVHGVDNIAAIELRGPLNTQMTNFETELAKRPSASH